jgi:hypothetical protein
VVAKIKKPKEGDVQQQQYNMRLAILQVPGSGFRVSVSGSGFRVPGSGFRLSAFGLFGLGFGVFRVWGLGLRT